MFQKLPLLLLPLLLVGSLQGQDLTEQLCPTRYEHEADGWAAKLDRKWILIDKQNRGLLDQLELSKEKGLPPGTEDLLGHLKEFHDWERLPSFLPRRNLETLAPIGAFGVRVNTSRTGSYTSEGLDKHQEKIAESVLNSAAFFNRDGESKRVEHELIDINGVRTLRVLVSTDFPDKGRFFLESWTVPGGDRQFTIFMLYPKDYRTLSSRTMRFFLEGFEGIKEAKNPFAKGKKLEITWPIILLFLLPFLLLPIVFLRKYKRPAPPMPMDPE